MSVPASGPESVPIRLLVVEDSELDFDLLTAVLARDGPPLRAERVEDEAGMREALERARVDAVLTDHNMPHFDSFAALKLAKAADPDLPVLVVSGEMSEDLAVAALHAGADDFILKSRLFRVGPALTRSLQAAAQRRAGRAAAAALADSEARLRELTRHLESAKEEERRRIAGEIHDDIGSMLTALRFETVALAKQMRQRGLDAPRLPLMLDLIGQLMAASHRIQHNLRPPVLDAGLVAALQWLVSSFAARTGVQARFESNREDVPLAPDGSVALYRAAQEALANVSKHAHAQQVVVQLFVSSAEVSLEVSDNGIGCDPRMLRSSPGFGLRALLERARGLGGWAEVSSTPKGGASVMISIPVRTDAAVPRENEGANLA
ncbi:MAG TPA: response regulator [Burkholderiaceae bacterium]|jgi:two-component system sensor histidine kinase UhpB|nr:response regulator [Burkholderiaceae bacterium]